MLFLGSLLIGGVVVFAGCANPLQQEQTQTTTQTETAQNEMGNGKNMPMRGGMNHGMGGDSIEGIAKGELDAAEKVGILKMREEEKLARDVYTTLGAKWGQNIFLNITSSEQTHMDEVKQLIDRYALVDPVTDGTVGSFTSPEMQKLYTALIAKGNVSLVEALKVGATIEDMDIKDLQDLIAATDNEDIKYVYENLKSGSQKHLQSFVKNIEKNGAAYAPQFISQAEYAAIIAMEKQMGGKMGDGGCMDGGEGCGMHGDGGGCMDSANGMGCGMQNGSGGEQGNGMGGGMRHMQ